MKYIISVLVAFIIIGCCENPLTSEPENITFILKIGDKIVLSEKEQLEYTGYINGRIIGFLCTDINGVLRIQEIIFIDDKAGKPFLHDFSLGGNKHTVIMKIYIDSVKIQFIDNNWQDRK